MAPDGFGENLKGSEVTEIITESIKWQTRQLISGNHCSRQEKFS